MLYGEGVILNFVKRRGVWRGGLLKDILILRKISTLFDTSLLCKRMCHKIPHIVHTSGLDCL